MTENAPKKLIDDGRNFNFKIKIENDTIKI